LINNLLLFLLLLLLLLPCSRWRDSCRGVVEEQLEEEEEEEDGGMMGGADLGAMLQGMSGPDAQVGGCEWPSDNGSLGGLHQ
jgi:hypothetical protein